MTRMRAAEPRRGTLELRIGRHTAGRRAGPHLPYGPSPGPAGQLQRRLFQLRSLPGGPAVRRDVHPDDAPAAPAVGVAAHCAATGTASQDSGGIKQADSHVNGHACRACTRVCQHAHPDYAPAAPADGVATHCTATQHALSVPRRDKAWPDMSTGATAVGAHHRS